MEPGRHTSGPTCASGRVLTPVRTVTGTSRTQTGAGGAFRAGHVHGAPAKSGGLHAAGVACGRCVQEFSVHRDACCSPEGGAMAGAEKRVLEAEAYGEAQGETARGFRGSLEPPGSLLEPPGPLLTHLHTVYMACYERLPTRLNPVAERTCFSQARRRPSTPSPTAPTTRPRTW